MKFGSVGPDFKNPYFDHSMLAFYIPTFVGNHQVSFWQKTFRIPLIGCFDKEEIWQIHAKIDI